MNGLLGFIVLIFGLISVFSPHTIWYLSIGWKLKDSEPSDAALTMNRVSGVIAVFLSIIILFSSCSAMFAGGGGNQWKKDFQARVAAGEISQISFFSGGDKYLTEEQQQEMIEILQEAVLTSFDTGDGYSAAGTGWIQFENGDRVDLVLFGKSGGIELHPRGMNNKAFKIESAELESLIRVNVTKFG